MIKSNSSHKERFFLLLFSIVLVCCSFTTRTPPFCQAFSSSSSNNNGFTEIKQAQQQKQQQQPQQLQQDESLSLSSVLQQRRSFLNGVIATTTTITGGVLSSLPSSKSFFVANAAAPMDATEAIRRSAANIPGYGQTDVFYPSSLAGSWTMIRSVEIPGRDEPFRLTYPFRFVQSIEDDSVVADRGYNQAELEKAIVQQVVGKGKSNVDNDNNTNEVDPVVRSYEWVRTNPNDLRLTFSDGFKKEIKVTKRATERTDTTVSSSEFQRVTQEDTAAAAAAGKGIPTISARRVVTKWKIVDDTTVEGLEVVYNMPGGGDPMMSATTSQGSGPSILSKSRLLLKR